MSQETINLIITSSVGLLGVFCGAFFGILSSLMAVLISNGYQKGRDKQIRRWELEDKKREIIETEITKFEEWLGSYYHSLFQTTMLIHSLPEGNYPGNFVDEIETRVGEMSEMVENITIKASTFAYRNDEIVKDVETLKELFIQQSVNATKLFEVMHANHGEPKDVESLRQQDTDIVENARVTILNIQKKLRGIRDSLYKG